MMCLDEDVMTRVYIFLHEDDIMLLSSTCRFFVKELQRPRDHLHMRTCIRRQYELAYFQSSDEKTDVDRIVRIFLLLITNPRGVQWNAPLSFLVWAYASKRSLLKVGSHRHVYRKRPNLTSVQERMEQHAAIIKTCLAPNHAQSLSGDVTIERLCHMLSHRL